MSTAQYGGKILISKNGSPIRPVLVNHEPRHEEEEEEEVLEDEEDEDEG